MTIDDAVTYASVVNEEVWWALVCVVVGYSSNSSRPMSGLFPVMFSDSQMTAAKYQLGPDKLSYSIWFGFSKVSLCTMFKTLIITV